MQDLIRKLEEAETGSRMLNFLIFEALGWQDCDEYWVRNYGTENEERYEHTQPPDFTGNLQDALGLVPEGWFTDVAIEQPGRGWSWGLGNAKTGHVGTSKWCPTPALALVIACLKARKG